MTHLKSFRVFPTSFWHLSSHLLTPPSQFSTLWCRVQNLSSLRSCLCEDHDPQFIMLYALPTSKKRLCLLSQPFSGMSASLLSLAIERLQQIDLGDAHRVSASVRHTVQCLVVLPVGATCWNTTGSWRWLTRTTGNDTADVSSHVSATTSSPTVAGRHPTAAKCVWLLRVRAWTTTIILHYLTFFNLPRPATATATGTTATASRLRSQKLHIVLWGMHVGLVL